MGLSSIVKKSNPIIGGNQETPTSTSGEQAAAQGGEYKKLTYCRVLSGIDDPKPSSSACNRAWKSLQKSMALVPTGTTLLVSRPVGLGDADTEGEGSGQHVQLVEVAGCYIDRLAVTCADFSMFVRAGGYTDMSLWPNEIWPHVVQFVDETGTAGPRWWRNGRPARDKLEHPVTGICWYEASAFAKWAGKSLPNSAQWQRAGSWQADQEGKENSLKYPWGNLFEAKRANVWASGIGTTVPVDQYYDGCTPNGVFQLIGNAWEWVDGRFVCPGTQQSRQVELGEIRGGAFDTYFASQVTCQFRSGQPKLYRGPNISLRCCIPLSHLKHAPGQPCT